MNSAQEAVPATGVTAKNLSSSLQASIDAEDAWLESMRQELIDGLNNAQDLPVDDSNRLHVYADDQRWFVGRVGRVANSGQMIFSAYFKRWLNGEQMGRCGYCGDRLGAGRDAQIDHVIPRSIGGANLPPNLVYACSSCNAGKCNRGIADVRNMLRVRQSKCAGIIIPKQALALEALGIDLGMPKSFVFLCESENWTHVVLPKGII